jgi:protein-S-isoprenylcysteine O-methyltransferase Ste14
MYAGASLLLIATPLALGSWWAIVPAAFAIAGIIWRLIEEEKFLTDQLPGYPEYCRKVQYRLVPFVW